MLKERIPFFVTRWAKECGGLFGEGGIRMEREEIGGDGWCRVRVQV